MTLRRRYAACLIALALPAGCDGKNDQKKGAPPPQDVSVVTMHHQAVALETELPGRMEAYLTADIRPQVAGLILKRLFVEGSDVKVGQQLYQIDPSLFQATYDSDVAAVAKAVASEVSTAAMQRRYKPLSQAQAVSKQDYDNAVASEGEGKADIASAKATLETARINLAYTKVLAPISGRIGRSSVTPGALVTADQTTSLATVTQLDPIYADFTQSSALRLRLQQELASGRLKRDQSGGVPIKLILEDNTPYAHPGELQFSEVTVTEATGTFVMRGLVQNPDKLLLPGMFVRGVLQEGVDQNAYLVPEAAVSRNTRGDATVMVVGPDNTVKEVVIQTSRTSGTNWIVDKGVADGDRIVVSGLQMIHPGSSVKPTEQTADQAGATPNAGPAPTASTPN